jgi:hypothetical protein
VIGFPPQVNNKVLVLTEEERRILNSGPKFVPANPKQALERLEKEIRVMKSKVTEAWKRETKTISSNPPIVEQFANRLETELRQQISLDLGGDKTIEKTLKQFQKKQKNGTVQKRIRKNQRHT